MNWLGLEPLKRMIVKEFTQTFRDPGMIRMIFLMPLIQVLLFGYVVNLDVRHVPLAVYDLDNSAQSRDLIARFLGSGYFEVAAYIRTDREAVSLINGSTVKGVLKINHGFGGRIEERKAAPVQLILDGTDSNSTSITLGYAASILQAYNGEIQIEQMQRVFGPFQDPGGVNLIDRVWFNENLESQNFYLPALIGIIVMTAMVSMSSMAIVREKEIGTIEQIMVTPISKLEFILGKTIPFVLIALIEASIIGLMAVFWFKVPMLGSVLFLFLGTLLFIVATLGVGLLISTISQTQQQAMLVAFFFQNPYMQFSGFVFPVANMPRIVQGFADVNPLRYYLIVLRGVFLKGIGPEILWPELVKLGVLGVIILSFAVFRFRKTAG